MKTITDKHTPGPWYPLPEYSNGGEVHSAAGRICDASIGLGERQEYRDAHRAQSEANARLIAESPALLESLSNLLYCAQCDPRHEERFAAMFAKARAVVARIEGGAR